jgi:cation transport ATPase
LGAYFNIDVTLVRVIFVILTILTHGAWILVYFIMAVVIPYANTSEQKAEAYGLPFNAQELLERAREKYAHFDKEYWREYKKQWKDQAQEQVQRAKEVHQKAHHHAKQRAREMRRNAHQSSRQYAREFRQNWENEWYKKVPASGHYHTGIGTAILVLMMMLITFAWLAAIFSLLTTGMILGVAFTTLPVWATILLLTCAYNILLFPIRRIKAGATSYNPYGHYYGDAGWFGLLDTIMWFTIMGVMGWALWTYVPQSHEVFYKATNWAQETFHVNTTEQQISSYTQQQTMENN